MEKQPTAETIYSLLIKLLAEQEEVKITYRLESGNNVRGLQKHAM